MHVEGGFNVFRYDRSNLTRSTLIPYTDYAVLNDAVTGKPLASNLTPQGYPVNYGSSWMFVMNFTENGPEAKGLLTMSQSSDSHSEHFDDQSRINVVAQNGDSMLLLKKLQKVALWTLCRLLATTNI